VTAPLVWLLLSTVGLIASPSATTTAWEGKPLLVVTKPQQPVSGAPMTVLIGVVPKKARTVELLVDTQRVRTTRRPSGLWKASVVAPAPGPATLTVRFTLHGTRYEAQGGIVLVAPAAGAG
jgi:hypothetical protein